jgi:hypothetical protein
MKLKLFKKISNKWNQFTVTENNSLVTSGTALRRVQAFLWDNGYAVNPENKTREQWVDGLWGPNTSDSVFDFQTAAKKMKNADGSPLYDFAADRKIGRRTLTAIRNYSSALKPSGTTPTASTKPATIKQPEKNTIKKAVKQKKSTKIVTKKKSKKPALDAQQQKLEKLKAACPEGGDPLEDPACAAYFEFKEKIENENKSTKAKLRLARQRLESAMAAYEASKSGIDLVIMRREERAVKRLEAEVEKEEKLKQNKIENLNTFEKVKEDDAGLAEAIEKMSQYDPRDSKLFYDGDFLYWIIDQQVIRKWPATSGKADYTFERPILIRVMLDLLKVLQNDSLSDDEKISKLRTLVEYDPTSGQETIFMRRQHAEMLLKSFKTNNRKAFLNMTRHIFDIYNLSGSGNEWVSVEDKKELSGVKNYGPIPEGPYSLRHKLQEADIKADPSIYDSLVLAMEDYVNSFDQENYGEGELHPYQKISKEEWQEVIGKRATQHAEVGGEFGARGFGGLRMGSSANVNDDRANPYTAAAWGHFRVRISKVNSSAKKMMKRGAGYNRRDGFLIHGGTVAGSSGCIDLGEEMDDFAKFWTVSGVGKAVYGGMRAGSVKKANFSIPLYVKYSKNAKENLKDKNYVAKNLDNIIFNRSPETQVASAESDPGV